MIDCPRTDAGRDEQQVHQRVHQPRGRGDEPQGREGEEDRQRGVSRPCVAVSFCFSALLLLLLLLLLLWLLPGDTLTAHDEVAKQVLHPPAGMLLVAPGVLGERRPHEGDTDGMEDGEAGEGEQHGVDGRRQERADLGSQRGQRGHRAGNSDNCDKSDKNERTFLITRHNR